MAIFTSTADQIVVNLHAPFRANIYTTDSRKLRMSMRLIYFLLIIVLALGACKSDRKKDNIDQVAGGLKSKMKYAHNFLLLQKNTGSELAVINALNEIPDTTFYQLNSDSEKLKSWNVIPNNCKRVVALSAPHAAMLEALGLQNRIVGISNRSYFFSSAIQKGVDSGAIAELGFGQSINKELLISLKPDLMIISGDQNVLDSYPFIIEKNIALLTINAWMENHPLGRAEWIKAFGMAFNQREKADSIFVTIEKEYDALKSRLKELHNSGPDVMINAPYKGTWFVAGGKSYMSQLIKDAGGHYLWHEDRKTGALPLDFESVYATALDADVWLNPGSMSSLNLMRETDERYVNFKAFKEHRVYNNTARVNEFGGNDYFESGLIYPNEVLADLAYIFHPEKLPGHQLKYFKRLK
jgi:iron complex transport system substrate-binding protein